MKKQLSAVIISSLLLLGASNTPDAAAMEFTFQGDTVEAYKLCENDFVCENQLALGQSFIATDPYIGGIGFYLFGGELYSGMTEMELYRGEGMSGELLLRAVDSLAPGVDDLIDSAVGAPNWSYLLTTGIAFETGQTYTIVVKPNSVFWDVNHISNINLEVSQTPDYEGGHLFLNGVPMEEYDTAFRIKPRPPVTEIPVDIKATSCPNPLNVKSNGVLPVAILGTEDLDVYNIDPDSVEILGVSPVDFSYEDVSTPYTPFIGKEHQLDCNTLGADGFTDMTMHFKRQEILAAIEQVAGEELVDGKVLTLPLTAFLQEAFGGSELKGEDVIILRGFKITFDVTDDWGSGYCADAVITNNSDEALPHPYGIHFVLPTEVPIHNWWTGSTGEFRMKENQDGQDVTVIYPRWFHYVEPGEVAENLAGFCVRVPSTVTPESPEFYKPDFSNIEITMDPPHNTWSTGYCARISLTNHGEALSVHPDFIRYKMPTTTEFTSYWENGDGGALMTRDGENVSYRYPYWVYHMEPGETVTTSGFCTEGLDTPYDFEIVE